MAGGITCPSIWSLSVIGQSRRASSHNESGFGCASMTLVTGITGISSISNMVGVTLTHRWGIEAAITFYGVRGIVNSIGVIPVAVET